MRDVIILLRVLPRPWTGPEARARASPAHTAGGPHSSYGGENMELLDVIVTFIQNVGFPIACVVAMFWMWDREREEHKTEAEKWAEALNNNTAVMQKLVDRLEEVR